MNRNIIKIALGVLIGSAMGLTSCNKEPDESSLYTFTGNTIQSYLQQDTTYTLFNKILQRANVWQEMATYGQYTCYAPSNEGVLHYVDSLWNDPQSLDDNGNLLHHNMTENSVDGLTDIQCEEIAKYHISTIMYDYTTLANQDGKEITTYLGQNFESKISDDGFVRLADVAAIDKDNDKHDIELTNGYLHCIDNVIPRNTQSLPDMMKNLPKFKLFFEALNKTGLIKKLETSTKTFDPAIKDNKGRPGSSMASGQYYVPTVCNVRYTIFAEDSTVFAQAGINNFADLKAKCVEWYKDAADWYDNPDGADISTGDDYENPYNVVNMFMAYHILKAGMPTSKLTYVQDKANANWNYAFGGEPHDYYETLLPHTLLKVWQPLYQQTPGVAATTLWVNRYRKDNTLTEEIGTVGDDENHPILRDGCRIMTAAGRSNLRALNGFIHTIGSPLVYDETVAKGVLNERMRFDTGSILYELSNNDIRYSSGSEIGGMNQSGSDGTMTRVPNDYFDNLKCYTSGTCLAWYTTGPWRAWEADQLSFWGAYDFAIKLPPVPSGTYEIRVIYPPMANSGLMQYYLGTSSEPSSMQPLGIPFDARYPNSGIEADRVATGYMLSSEFSDYGVASDLVMRNHGYMRAPASFSRGTYNGQTARAASADDLIATISNCCRYEEGYGTSMMRRILGTVYIDQKNEYWVRMRNLIPEETTLGGSCDFLELVPVGVVNNASLTEDWY